MLFEAQAVAYSPSLSVSDGGSNTADEPILGWYYWTWKTESAPQWSYKAGRAAGILPDKVYDRSFSCPSDLPDYAGMGLPEYY